MKNLLILVLGLFLVGCSTPTPSKNYKTGYHLAYVDLKDGELVSGDTFGTETERIEINTNGFSGGIKPDTYYCSLWFHRGKDVKNCKSYYSKFDYSIGNLLHITIWNGVFGYITLGLFPFLGGIPYIKTYDPDAFDYAIKHNKLDVLRNNLISLKNAEIEIFKKLKQEYVDNIKNISFDFQLEEKNYFADKFNLQNQFYFDKIKNDFFVIEPNETSLSYFYFQNTLSAFEDKKDLKKANKQDLDSVRKYAKDTFKSYRVNKGKNIQTKIQHNENIYTDIVLEMYKTTIPYEKNKKIKIPVEYSFTTKFENILPKFFVAEDANLRVEFTANGISLINKTKKFLLINSIASYLGSDVYSQNISIELSPEANKETYQNIFSDVQLANVNFDNPSKKDLDKKINYGYAIKYKLVETNVEKTIYQTKQFRILDILKTYLPTNN